MAKINSKALDPQRYACIQAEQRELEQQYSTHITMARLCPYCKLRLETLCKGSTTAAATPPPLPNLLPYTLACWLLLASASILTSLALSIALYSPTVCSGY